jgi:predicted SnoaL-like aldol condensation-catalyzing enzyme
MKCEFIDKRRGHGNTASMTTDNKSFVQDALAKLLTTGDVGVIEPVLRDDFVHHRPDSTTSTKAEWLASVAAALGPLAGMQVEVLHVLADDDHVVMHSRRRLPDGGPEITVVDILRVDEGLIAEVWEIIEPTAQAAANLTWWDVDNER